MSGWHRDNPELVGSEADPWMAHADYRQAMRQHWRESRDYCACGRFLESHERGVCEDCKPVLVACACKPDACVTGLQQSSCPHFKARKHQRVA